jgi:hypothetical protein
MSVGVGRFTKLAVVGYGGVPLALAPQHEGRVRDGGSALRGCSS